MTKNIKWIGLIAFLLIVSSVAIHQTPIYPAIHDNLLGFLTDTNDLPDQKTFDAIYILGGSQESLSLKYEILNSLYSQGRCKEIVILSRSGYTEYNPSLKRNMTHDEWSLIILNKYGIPEEMVQIVKIDDGYFGTYSEAEFVSRMAGEKAWNSLLLITSPHHTKRVIKSFTSFIDKKMLNIELWITASTEQVGLFDLWVELFKLKFYQFFLLT